MPRATAPSTADTPAKSFSSRKISDKTASTIASKESDTAAVENAALMRSPIPSSRTLTWCSTPFGEILQFWPAVDRHLMEWWRRKDGRHNPMRQNGRNQREQADDASNHPKSAAFHGRFCHRRSIRVTGSGIPALVAANLVKVHCCDPAPCF